MFMENPALTHPVNEAHIKAKEPERLQRWIRSALAGAILTISAVGDSAPASESSPNPPLPTQRATLHPLPLAPDQYLSELARTLRTPEDIETFLQQHVRYSSEPQGEDHWQTAQETLERGEGDCEDFAFLGQEILQRQGKASHVISPPGHAVCVWIEKRADGNYDVYTLDENRVDKNGRWEQRIRSPYDSVPIELHGFETIIEALNTALHKFEGTGGSPYTVHPYCIPVLRRTGTLQVMDVVTTYAFDPDAPLPARISGLELATLTALLGGAYGTYRLLRRRREGTRETWKEYLTTFRLS